MTKKSVPPVSTSDNPIHQSFLNEPVEELSSKLEATSAQTADTLPPPAEFDDKKHEHAAKQLTAENIIRGIGEQIDRCNTLQHGDYSPTLAQCMGKLQEAQALAQAAYTELQPAPVAEQP